MAVPHSMEARLSFAGSVIRVTSVKFEGEGQVADVTTLNDTYKSYVRGQADLTLGVEGIYDDPGIGSLVLRWAEGTAQPWIYYPAGTAAGKVRFSGTGFVTNHSIPADMDSAVTYSFDIQSTGTILPGTA